MKARALYAILSLLLLGFGIAAAQSGVNKLQSVSELKVMSPVVKALPSSGAQGWFSGQIAQLKSGFALWGSKPSLQAEVGSKPNKLEPMLGIRSYSLIGAKEVTKSVHENRLTPVEGIGLFSAEKSKP